MQSASTADWAVAAGDRLQIREDDHRLSNEPKKLETELSHKTLPQSK